MAYFTCVQDSFDIVSDSLDILNDVISKFGNLVAAEHGKVTNALLPFLDNNRTVIRKRGLQSLGRNQEFSSCY